MGMGMNLGLGLVLFGKYPYIVIIIILVSCSLERMGLKESFLLINFLKIRQKMAHHITNFYLTLLGKSTNSS